MTMTVEEKAEACGCDFCKIAKPLTSEVVHTNIGWANDYRLELCKTMLALSAALFAFTISFPPSLTKIDQVDVLAAGWIALGASTVGGLFNLYGWEKFYISFRNYRWDKPCAGKRYRRWLTRTRRAAHGVQFAGLALGIAALAWFVVINRTNVKLADPPKEITTGGTGQTVRPAARRLTIVDQSQNMA